MKILVTGGAGFIASHIVDAYLKLGHQVIVIDNLSTGKRKNINPKAKLYLGNLKNGPWVERVINRERPTVINHHAALASLRTAVRKPRELIESNIYGTMNILSAIGRYPIQKFIFSSSCSVLGHPQKLPARESTTPHPLSPYAFTKLANEEMIKFYGSWHQFHFVIFRYPNVYGPRQNPRGEAGVIPIFAQLLKRGRKPVIFGDGSKTRDYLYIDDVVKANVAALTKGENVILNLGWGKQISDQEIFDQVQKHTTSSLKPAYAPFRPWEALRISLNAGRAQKILDWQPSVSLADGIQKTIQSLDS